ncbi:low molecular weight phosphatase family protein [Ornithinimicrobium sp. W1665]|uniref:arsenate-mycothiol transferase ArsC n=2 Tax=Ornithinimicrobium sp. W1665 TaxID=3416666 RepID=UPI003CF0B67A
MQARSPMYERTLRRVQRDLTERFAAGFTADEVAEVVTRGRRQLEENGRHPEFIPALLEHWARDELLATARAEGRALSPLPKLLFVCEHNEGRSQVAGALAEHLSGGQVLVRSAGINPTGRLNPHAATVLAERGIELRNPLPQTVHADALDAADVIVLIGCCEDEADFAGRRTLRWDVDDPYAQDLSTARRIADELEARVRALLAELEVPVLEQEVARTAS